MLAHVWNAMDEAMAVLDAAGRIVAVNDAWRAMRHGFSAADAGLNRHYRELFQTAAGNDTPPGCAAGAGIARVLSGEVPGYELEYACRFPEQECWFLLRATRFTQGDCAYALLTHVDITERKRAEEALRESGAHFRFLFEQTPDGIFVADHGGRYIDVNSAGAAMIGYTREELLRLRFADLLVADEIPRLSSQIAPLAGGTIIRNEWRFRRKDGSEFCGELVGRQLPNGCFQGILRDITARQRAEDSLKVSEAKFAKAFRASPETFVINSMDDGKYIDVNDAFLRKTGYRREEVIGHTSLELDIWLDPSGRRKYLEELSQHGSLANVEVQFRMRNQEIRDFLISSEIIELKGKPCTLSFIYDITDRKRTEEALRRSEDRHRAILQTALDGFWLFNADARFLEVNAAYCQMSGYSAAELLTMGVADVEAVEDAGAVAARVRKIIARGEDRFETRHRGKDGRLFDVEISVQFRPTDGGVFVAFLRDITQRKGAEAAAQRHQAAVMHLARLNTMSQMARGLAHEINQPLTAIRNYAHYCKMVVQKGGALALELPAALDKVDQAAILAAQIIQRLREFVRKQEPVRTSADMNDIIRKALDLMGPALHIRRTRIDQRLEPGLPRVVVDQVQIEQALVNLIQNALDAMRDTPPAERLLVLSTRIHDNEAAIQVRVADSGCGIASDGMARLFEEFYTTKPDGLGLGLAISKSIVERHGGHLTAHPNPDGGMIFAMTLPAQKGT